MKFIYRLFFIFVLLGINPVSFAETISEKEIQYLLHHVEHSHCIFIRNGTEHDAESARSHIEKKYNYLKSRIDSAEDFIESAASKSSFSGKPYQIKCGDQTSSANEWLASSLKNYRSQN